MIVCRKITMKPWNKQCSIKTFFITFPFCQCFQSRTNTTVYMFDSILRLSYCLGVWFEKKNIQCTLNVLKFSITSTLSLSNIKSKYEMFTGTAYSNRVIVLWCYLVTFILTTPLNHWLGQSQSMYRRKHIGKVDEKCLINILS